MESIIIVLCLFSHFFSRSLAGFPLYSGVHQTAGSPGLTLHHLFPTPLVPRSRGSLSVSLFPPSLSPLSQILDCLSLEVKTEERKQMTTKNGQWAEQREALNSRAEWLRKPHWGNADFEATSHTLGLEQPVLLTVTRRIREVTV